MRMQRSPIACRVSRVALPTCGRSTALSMPRSGGGILGSSAQPETISEFDQRLTWQAPSLTATFA